MTFRHRCGLLGPKVTDVDPLPDLPDPDPSIVVIAAEAVEGMKVTAYLRNSKVKEDALKLLQLLFLRLSFLAGK